MDQIVASYRVGYKNCYAQLSVRLAVNLCWSGTSLLKILDQPLRSTYNLRYEKITKWLHKRC